MRTITVTRHFSGFRNVADRFQLGDHEADGDAAVSTYLLPAGYAIVDGDIVDPVGYVCTIVPGDDGAPIVMSLAGRAADQRLQLAA